MGFSPAQLPEKTIAGRADLLWLTRIFLVLALLVVCAFTALFVVPPLWDWSQHKAEFERQASALLGQPVTVSGDTSIRLLPSPKVRFEDILVGEAESNLQARVATFDMNMELAPLATGEVRIIDMSIGEPELTIIISESGSFGGVQVDADDSGLSVTMAERVVFENISVVGGSVTVIDQAADRTLQLSDINADLSARDLLGPWRADGALEAALISANSDDTRSDKLRFELSTGTIQAGIGFRTRLALWPERYPISLELAGDTVVEDGVPRLVGSFEVDQDLPEGQSPSKGDEFFDWWSANGQIEVTLDAVTSEAFELRIADPVDPYNIKGSAEFDIASDGGFQIEAAGERVDMKRFATMLPGANAVTLPERLLAFKRFMRSLPPIARDGAVNLSLPAMVVGGTVVRDLEIEARPSPTATGEIANSIWGIERFEAELPGRTKVRASGDLRTDDAFGFEGAVVIATNQPSGLVSLFADEVDPAIRTLARAGFAADVELGPEIQAFRNLELDLAGALLKGEIVHRFPDGTTAATGRVLSADLSGGVLDIDAMRAIASLIGMGGGDNQTIEAKANVAGLRAFGIEAGQSLADFSFANDNIAIRMLDVRDVLGMNLSAAGQLDGFSGADRSYDFDLEVKAPTLANAVAASGSIMAPELVSHLVSAPSLTADSDIKLKFVRRSVDGKPMLTLSGRGETGATSFVLDGEAEATEQDLLQRDLSLTLQVTQPEPIRFLRQLSLPAGGLPIGETLRGELQLSGAVQYGLSGKTTLRVGETRLDADGEWSLPATYTSDTPLFRQVVANQTLEFSSDDVAPWISMFGPVLPGQVEGISATLRSGFELANGQFRFTDMQGSTNDTAWAGDLDLETAGTRPRLEGELRADASSLDLLTTYALGQQTTVTSFADLSLEPFDTPVLSGLDGRVDLAVDELDIGLAAAPLEDVRARLVIDDGSLALNDVDASWNGAEVGGSIEIATAPTGASVAARASIGFTPLETIAPWASGLAGRVALDVDLQGSGATPSELISELTGSGILNGQNISISGLDQQLFPRLVAWMDAQEETPDDVALEAELIAEFDQGDFAVDEIAIPVSITGGDLRASSVRLKNEEATLLVDALLNLTTGRLEADGRLAYDPKSEAVAGATPEVDVSWTGPANDPQFEVTPRGLSGYFSLRAFEREQRRVELLQARILERQRLRREVRYYEALLAASEAEKARIRAEEQAAAAAEAAQVRERAAAQEARREAATLEAPAPQTNRGGELPPLETLDITPVPGLFSDQSLQFGN